MTTSYQAPLHIGVVLVGTQATEQEVAFWVEAVGVQLREHVAPAWGLPAPGIQLYTPDTYVPSAEGMIIAIVDDDGDDEAAGFHHPLGGMVDLGQSSVPSRTLSHEALEMFRNWSLDQWSRPDARGRRHAMELCDATQRVSYSIPIERFGMRWTVEVSDFVLPAWFQVDAVPGAQPFSHVGGVIGAPFELAPGGYSIALDGDEIVYLAHPDGMTVGRSKVSSRSRTTRIVELAA